MLKKLRIFKLSSKKTKHTVFKNMAVLASGAVVARVIGLASIPLLTRIYTPENFGVLSVFMATLAMISPFATLRYSVAIPLLRNHAIAANLLAITIVILCLVSILSLIIFSFFSIEIFQMLSLDNMIEYWWIFPIAIFGSGLYEILKSWFIRQKNFKILAKTDIYVAFSGSIIKIGMGLIGYKSMGLLIGGAFVGLIGSAALLLKSYNSLKVYKKFLRLSRIRLLFLHYSEYPKYRLPSQFLLVLSIQAPFLMLTSFFGTEVVGQFSLALMVLNTPIALLGSSMGQAYYAEIAKIGKKQPSAILQITKDVVKKLFLFSLAPFFLLLLMAPLLFSWIFGEVWYMAGEFARALSVYLVAAFISAPLVNVFSVFEKQFLLLKLNIIRIIVLTVMFSLSYLLDLNSMQTILLYSVTMFLYYSYINYMVFKVIKVQVSRGYENV